jgi:hypothetical protein
MIIGQESADKAAGCLPKPDRMQRNNGIFYAIREGSYSTAALFISGTLIQLFLAQQGVATIEIGTFNTVLCIISLAATMHFSDLAERKPNAVRQIDGLLLAISLIFACYLPLFFATKIAPKTIWVVVMAVASLQIVLASCKGVLDYKMLYQIIDIDRYGPVGSMTGVAIGLFGMAYSWLFSQGLLRFSAKIAFPVGFLSSALLVMAAYWCNRRLKILHQEPAPPPQQRTKAGLVLSVLRQPEFKFFIIPNILRGVTIGIMNSLVLVALELGVSTEVAANLAIAGSTGYLLGSLVYNALSRAIRAKYLALIGAGLLCVVMLLPLSGKGVLFLVIAMLGYMGRTLVDFAVPSMVFQMIDPAVSGVYNAWRTVLFSVSAAGMSYAAGALLGKIPVLVLLVACAASYLVCAAWYYVSLNRFIGKCNLKLE